MSKSPILPTYHPIAPINTYKHHGSRRRNSFAEVSDHVLRTKRFRVLSVTLGIFLFSLWVVANFSGSGFNIHTLQHYNQNSRAAMAAASVLGDGGEEGIHGLEVENHGRVGPNGHNHGIHEPLNGFDLSSQRFFSDSPNIAKQRFEEALKNDPQLYYYYDADSEPQTKVELEIDDLVHENPVVIFSKSYCSYSQRAEDIFSQYHIFPSVLIIKVDKRDDADDVKQALMKLTNRNTFPNIFIDGRSVGGSDELATMHANGRLKELLIDAGVLENSRPAL